MRFLVSAALFVVSITLLLIGLGQRTIWAPPPSVSMSIEVENPSAYILLDDTAISAHPGSPRISISGDSKVFAATANQADALAWLGNDAFTRVSLDKSTAKLKTTQVFGSKASDNPSGSDLWRNEIIGNTAASIQASTSVDTAVLIASNGFKKAPGKIEVIWPIAYDLTPSNILLITGLVFLIGAIVFNYLGFRHLRNKRGPRRKMYQPPKPPKYRFKSSKSNTKAKGRRSAKRNLIAVPASILILAMLAGCSGEATPKPTVSSNENAETAASPVVTRIQLNRILGNVAKIAAVADKANDKSILESRFTGPALEIRKAHYTLMKRSTKVAALPNIVASPLTFSLPAATDKWPRTIMAVTDEPGDAALPQMLVLQQQTPRSNYSVWYYVRLMPGAKIPAVPAPEVGSIPIDRKSLFLKLQPTKLPAAYGDVINKGQGSLSASLFDLQGDEFFKQVSQSQKDQVTNLKTAKITFIHRLGEPNIQGLSTAGAGALVAVYMTDIYQIKPKTNGSAVAVSGQEKILLGADGSTRGVRSQYGDMLLFYVPALSDKANIRLLGATQGLVSVRSL
jgi:hypothetical protein